MTDKAPLALIVDDEDDIRLLIEMTLNREGVDCRCAADIARAQQLIESGEHFDFCLTDMRLPDGDGLDLLDWIKKRQPDLPVAVITAYGHMEAAVRALKAGAFDFVSKPIELDVLRRLTRDALRAGRYRSETTASTVPQQADSPTQDEKDHSPLIGQSAPMQQLRQQIARVARSQAPVFIFGESGTGKELVARQIHAQSARRDGPFVPVNCGAIPAELLESELFGHKKGAFTGASAESPGLFKTASGGTLFLDEIAELPLSMQVKLLRAIQERRVRPVGATQEIPVDVRIVSASHQDLAAAVEAGRFRHDLYYRINVIELTVPPLRERLDDLPQLARHILAKLATRENMPTRRLSTAALHALSEYSFPGNVRELENILERALALSEDEVIGPELLALNGIPLQPKVNEHRMTSSLPQSAGTSEHSQPLNDEKARVIDALEATRWNRTEAAKRLGMTLRQLRYRLAKWGIE
ncbi:MAG TPA: sigma-54-dependent Fis family transcriptional regulator [Halothiobacillus sp.]|nr:sigma-54-dependent Fis family transcriptional regulator [Halothiobacillus sp.]